MSRKNVLQNTRNMGIFAHVDAGKTTCTERILFLTGATHKMGDVDDGNTVTDHMEQEKERGITICAAAVTCEWKGRIINLIDTPGHVDFTQEVVRSLRVLDGGVLVLCARKGVQSETKTRWRRANTHRVPRLIFVNKMDTEGADFYRVFAAVEKELTPGTQMRPVALQLPIGQSREFRGVVDLLSRKGFVWDESDPNGTNFHEEPIPADLTAQVEEYRQKLVEAIAETDDTLIERYLSEEEISEEELRAALRKAVVALRLVPVLCGSAGKCKAVQPLLDAVVDYLPSPLEVDAVEGKLPDGSAGVRKCSDDEPLAALDFKVVADDHGALHFVRVYSGKLKAGSYVYNPAKKVKERISRLVKLQGNRRHEVQELAAGDIGAIIGLKSSTTGNTLCDENQPILLESIDLLEPVLSMAVEPKNRDGSQKLTAALQRLAIMDPSFRYRTDEETGQILISGQGELHLDVMVRRMKDEDNVEVTTGKPQVSYRETVRSKATGVGDFKRQTGGRGMYGHVVIELEPLPAGSGFEFVDAIVGGAIPREFIGSVEKGIREALQTGPLSGSPVIDVRVTLVDGKYHEVDSNDMAFQIAGSLAFKDAFAKARPVLLEPIMKLEVTVPETSMGGIMGDIARRRGKVQGMDSLNGLAVVRATVPLAETFDYINVLRSATQGQGDFDLNPSHYDEVPGELAEEIVSKGRA